MLHGMRMEELLGLPILIFAAAGYFLPSMIADANDHPATGALIALNVFLGWTVIGWIIAFVWAMSEVSPTRPPSAPEERRTPARKAEPE